MSVTRKLLALAAGVLLMATAACASTGQFDPATGQRVTTVESGVCSPGETQAGKSCICDRRSGNYENCSFRTVAKAPPRSQWSYSDCMLQTLVPFQACLSGALNSYGPASVGSLYGGGGSCTPGQYCCPRARYGETTHPLCGYMPPQPYRRP